MKMKGSSRLVMISDLGSSNHVHGQVKEQQRHLHGEHVGVAEQGVADGGNIME
jgi:hypothetical protein